MNLIKLSAILLALLATLITMGCASNASQGSTTRMGEQAIVYGTITRIDPTTIEGDHQLGLGAIIGAAAGGLLGSGVGEGSGRVVAEVVGAIGGGYVGNQVQNKYVDKQNGSHIIVRLDNGVTVAITQPEDPNLRVGDRVMVQGSGQKARVSRI